VNFIGEDGERHQAVMIHRAVLGSMERFCGGLIEHYAGRFPLWLAPVQVAVLPISDRHQEAAQKITAELKANDVRAKLDDRSETIQYRIREAQLEQIPYMVVIGDKELENDVVAIRHRQGGQVGTMKFAEFLAKVKEESNSRQ